MPRPFLPDRSEQSGARFVLVRHPRIQLSSGVCYGRLDLPLAEDADIAGMVRRLDGLTSFRLWSSPARRCTAVAAAISIERGIAFQPDSRLLELDFGEWEGKPWSDVPRADLDRWAVSPLSFAPPGGESGASLVARVTACFEEIDSDAGPHVIVSHGGPLRLLAALIERRPIDLLAPSPPLGSVRFFTAQRCAPEQMQSTTHSATASEAPSTSPV